MNGIIIYKGKYGATQQYAQWLGEATGMSVVPATAIEEEQLSQYELLVIGSSVYIGRLQIKKWLKKNLAYIRNKKILFFQVAGAPPGEKEKRQTYNEAGIPRVIMPNCEFFYLPGRLLIKKLSRWDRFMLKMGARFTKDLTAKKTMLTDYDQVKKEHIYQLAEKIKQLILVEDPPSCALPVYSAYSF